MAIILVGLYAFLFLGSFSPIHCRCICALAALVCVGFAYISGFGFMFMCGMKTTGVHQLMPFLLIAIGIDDVFVLCNSVDQTALDQGEDTAYKRIHEAIGHSGPAVTITSFTNILAFGLGAANSLEALSSFCLFASMCILMLYLSALTLFLSVLVWDTERVSKKRGECCGACMCKEDTPICCKGSCLSIN